ncbi:SDR family NAD(P)-dependent oxidoreductase [Vibrio sp. PP-XX7]
MDHRVRPTWTLFGGSSTRTFGTLAVTQAMLPLLKKVYPGADRQRLRWSRFSRAPHDDPNWEYAPYRLIGYGAAKAAVNMLTIQLAAELRDAGIKVNAADPGFTATDLNGYQGHQAIPQGAAEAIRLALLDDDGPTGAFFSAEGREPW